MVIMTRFSKQKLSNGVLSMGSNLQQGNLAFLSQRRIIKNYKEAKVENEELRELPRKDRDAKTLLPSKLYDKVLQMIKNMRQARCVVNYNIAIAVAKGIVLANDWTLLKGSGGKFKHRLFMVSINFLKYWPYQKANNNSKAPCVSWFSELDEFLLSLGY